MSCVKKLSTALICMCFSAAAQRGPEAITSPISNPIPHPIPINLGPWNNFQLSGPGSIAPTGRIAALSRNSSTMEVFWNASGVFDTQLEWPTAGDAIDSASELATVLREQTGLVLEGRKLPVDLLVIDQAERPTEN